MDHRLAECLAAVVLVLALASPPVQVFSGPGNGVVVRVHPEHIGAYEAIAGDGPGGWGRELWRIDGLTDVRFEVYCRGAYYAAGTPCQWRAATCADLDGDGDIDLEDFAAFQAAFSGE